MMTLRVFELTKEAEERGIDWSNFEQEDIETVEEIEVDNPNGEAGYEYTDKIMSDHGYGDSDIYGCEWI